VPGYESGNFLGPTIIDNSNPGNVSYDEEIFAPVMSIVRVDTLDEAI
jgi:malonate-semialdehyde dehydrogenase (acetylating)/methylmalonate-semialdehyde dehydrogenase